MLNLDPAKLLVIVVIVVIGFMVIGPERMPRVARQLGTMLRTVRSYREQAESEIRKAIPDLDLPRIPTNPASALSAFLTSLTTSGGHVSVEESVTGSSSASGEDATVASGDEPSGTARPRSVSRASDPSESVRAGHFGIPEMN